MGGLLERSYELLRPQQRRCEEINWGRGLTPINTDKLFVLIRVNLCKSVASNLFTPSDARCAYCVAGPPDPSRFRPPVVVLAENKYNDTSVPVSRFKVPPEGTSIINRSDSGFGYLKFES